MVRYNCGKIASGDWLLWDIAVVVVLAVRASAEEE